MKFDRATEVTKTRSDNENPSISIYARNRAQASLDERFGLLSTTHSRKALILSHWTDISEVIALEPWLRLGDI